MQFKILPGPGGGSDSISHFNVSLILSIIRFDQAEQLILEDSETNLATIYNWDSISASHKDLDRRVNAVRDVILTTQLYIYDASSQIFSRLSTTVTSR